jgi:ABC-type branched-subunit amino acid transport system substrate-binding protein
MFRRRLASAARGAEGRGAAVTRPERSWTLRGIAVLGVAALALAACGDDGGDEDGGDGGDSGSFEGTFNLGLVLPTTGGLATFGEGMIAASELAVQDINAAGGVWGSDVNLISQDEGPAEEAEVVQAAADTMISQGAHAVIGAASSTSTLNVIETFFNQQIIQISPSNTGVALSNHEFGDFYFRTAPSDVLQGSVLAEVAIEDGNQTMAIMAQQTPYGQSLAEQIEAVFTAGGGEVVATEFYDLAQTEYAGEAQTMADAAADAFVLISYEESRQIIPALVGAGLEPSGSQWYLVDGNNLDYSEDFDPGLMEGAKATTPGPAPEDFFTRLAEYRQTPETVYTPESYDAVIAVALAAIAADADDKEAIRDAMFEVVSGGTKCTAFDECKTLLESGEDIDYDGVTGPISWESATGGDPTEATIGIFEYGAENTTTRIDERVGQL